MADTEQEFDLVLEVHVKGFGKLKHRVELAEAVLRDLQTVHHGDDVKVYMMIEEPASQTGSIKRRINRTDRNGASIDAGIAIISP